MIVCKSPAEIERMRPANTLVAAVLEELRAAVRPGITTRELDRLAEARIAGAGAEALFKGYHGYPATICASVNEQIIHGIPSDRALVEGDIISIDVGRARGRVLRRRGDHGAGRAGLGRGSQSCWR